MWPIHLWQSQVEIKHYSVVYFNRVTVFKALKHKSSVNSLQINDAFQRHEYIPAFASLFPKIAMNYRLPSSITVFITPTRS